MTPQAQSSLPEQAGERAPKSGILTGAEMLVESLRAENVEVIFGYPGGAVLPVYDALYQCGIPHILTRHEQGSIHAAEGYARVTGRPGVVIATSGPGATNLVTGLTDAIMDSLPLVVFTGQVATKVIGTDAFQEASILGITMPVTKHSYQVQNVRDLPMIIKEAFHIASTGRPGPVLIDLPKDIANASGPFDYSKPVRIPGYQPTFTPNSLQIKKVAQALRSAKRPLVLAGAGVLHARATKELRQFAETTQVPVTNTLLGLGSFPGDHPLFLGMAGMHGTYASNMAIYECDLLINIGARFDDRLTGNLEHFAKGATVVHIDIDPAEIGKNVPTAIPVVGDAKNALKMLLDESVSTTDAAAWREKLHEFKVAYPFWYRPDSERLKPQRMIEIIHEETNGEAVVVTDVGQHQMWAAQYFPFRAPGRWVTSGGLGTMGFGLPAAIGAQLGLPEAPVFAVVGDGGFQMTMQELAVIVEYQIPVKVVVLNNRSLGMVRQWQEFFHGRRYSESLIPVQPDFVKLADAFGMPAFLAQNEAEATEKIRLALETPGPVLIDCHVPSSENVYPMVAPGSGIHEMVGVTP